MLETLSDLREKAFAIKEMIPLACTWVEHEHNGFCVVPFYPEAYLQSGNNRTFNVQKNVMAFVTDDILYVIPKCKAVMDIFMKERFSLNPAVAVPFAHGEMPWSNPQREQWEKLLLEAKSGKF